MLPNHAPLIKAEQFGTLASFKDSLEKFMQCTGVNEVMAKAHIYDHASRLNSYSLFAAAMKSLGERLNTLQ